MTILAKCKGLSPKAELDTKDNYGNTCLHSAIKGGHYEVTFLQKTFMQRPLRHYILLKLNADQQLYIRTNRQNPYPISD